MSLRAIATSFTAVNYQGTWDASSNTPTLTSSVGVNGSYYIVSVAGNTNLNGITNWGVGDWVVFNGSVWERLEGGPDGNFVNLTVSGTTTLSGLTASKPVFTDASDNLTSNGTVPINQGGTGQTTASAGFNALSPITATGDLIVGNGVNSATRVGVGSANQVIHGGTTPTYSAVVEADISLSNNTTNNASASAHGFLPILPNNATLFLNGQGNFATPTGSSIANSYYQGTFTSQTTVNVVHNFGAYPVVQIIDNTGAVLIPQSITNNTLNDFTVVLSVSTSGTIIASLGSPQPQAVTIAAGATYAVLTTDRIIQVTAANAVITLPTAVGATGREYLINNASLGSITVKTTSSQLINNQLTQVVPSYSTMDVFSNGSAYWMV